MVSKMEIETTLEASSSILAKTLTTFGWSAVNEEFPKLVCCPIDENHWVPENRLEVHTQYCTLRQQGYLKDEIEAMIPQPESVTNHSAKQSRIDWTNDPQWNANLQAFEVNKRNRIRLMLSNSTDPSESTSSKLEALALMRDLKRRRQSYRGIHTAKKSYTEVLRELIAHQTELLLQSAQSESIPRDRKSSPGYNSDPDSKSCPTRSRFTESPNPCRSSDRRTHRHTDQLHPSKSIKASYSPDPSESEKSRHHHHHEQRQQHHHQPSPTSQSKHSKKSKKHKHKHHKHK